jgi:alkylhydroperoxidase family enzyme
MSAMMPGASRMSTRFPPIPREQLDDAQRAVFDAIVSGPRGQVSGPFNVLRRAPVAGDAAQRLGASLRFSGLLDDRLREIAICTVSRRWSAQYEWFAHHPIAVKAGVDPAALERLRQGEDPRFADAAEQLVWRLSRTGAGARTTERRRVRRRAGGAGRGAACRAAGRARLLHAALLVLNVGRCRCLTRGPSPKRPELNDASPEETTMNISYRAGRCSALGGWHARRAGHRLGSGQPGG